jgi:hypothetical protein
MWAALPPGGTTVTVMALWFRYDAARSIHCVRTSARRNESITTPEPAVDTPSRGTGTVMRRSTLTDYATRAGFTSVEEVLPIRDFAFFRFYQLLHRRWPEAQKRVALIGSIAAHRS